MLELELELTNFPEELRIFLCEFLPVLPKEPNILMISRKNHVLSSHFE